MYGALTAEDRAVAVDGVGHVIDRSRLELARIVAAAMAADDHRVDGAASMAEWLCERLAMSRPAANDVVRVAEALDSMPAMVAALEAGDLGWEQAVRVVELTERCGREAHWVELAKGASVSRLDTLVRSAMRHTRDQADAINGEARLRFRAVHTTHGVMRRVSGLLPAEEAEAVEVALGRVAAEHALARDADGAWHPRGRQLADALVLLASARLAADADHDRATIVIHTQADVVDGGDGWARLTDATPVAADIVRRYCCDGRLQLLTTAPDGTPTAAAQVKAAITASMARAVRFRDLGHCQFPRCARRATHTHHITWRSRGGPTTIDNLISLCTRCHKRVHEGGWTLTGTPETLTTTPPGIPARAGPPPRIAPTLRERIAGLLPRHPQPTPAAAFNAG